MQMHKRPTQTEMKLYKTIRIDKDGYSLHLDSFQDDLANSGPNSLRWVSRSLDMQG